MNTNKNILYSIILFIFTAQSCSTEQIVDIPVTYIQTKESSNDSIGQKLRNSTSPLGAPPEYTSDDDIQYDYSKKAQIKVFTKAESGNDVKFTIPVESGYIAIDGGAFIDEDYNDNLDTYILESRPSSKLTHWIIRTKTFFSTKNHRVIGYVIGLKIKDITATNLFNNMKTFFVTSADSERPYVEAVVEPEYKLIGGGASSQSPLISSFPDFTNRKWFAMPMKYPSNTMGNITAIAIGIKDQFLSKNKIELRSISKDCDTSSDYLGCSISAWGNEDLYQKAILISFGGKERTGNDNFRRGLVTSSRVKKYLNTGERISKNYPNIETNKKNGYCTISGIFLKVNQ